MNKICRLLIVAIVVLGGFSCATFRTNRSEVVEDCGMSVAEFLSPYHEAWKALEPSESKKETIGESELVHLGLPTQTSVVIWYALAEGVKRTDDFILTAKEGNGPEHDVPGGTIRHVFNATHSVGRIEVSRLAPGSKYTFVMRGGGFRGPKKVEATTQPSKPAPFSFLVGSCFQPWNIGKGEETYLTEETTALLRAFEKRALARKAGNGPSFYLGLGDQIYVDPGAEADARIAYLHGHFSQKMRGKLDDAPHALRGLYRYHLGLRPMDAAFSELPSAMMWDDHDIRDGWGSQNDEGNPSWKTYYSKAREAFIAFQAARNPAYRTTASPDVWETVSEGAAPKTPAKSELHFSFSWGNADFFVVDGRSNRNFAERRGMSDEQLDEVDKWLARLTAKQQEPRLIVFCFPVPLAGGRAMPGIIASMFDWSLGDDARERAYILEKERKRLLQALYGHARKNPKHRLLILSGDVHYSGIQLLRDTTNNDAVLGYEIVSSGLAQTEFNTFGAFWLTVARTEYDGVRLENHGVYAGPSFAEIFVESGDSSTPPKPKLLFYPAAELSGKKHKKRGRTFELDVSRITAAFARDPEDDYPPNQVAGGIGLRQRTTSRLHEFLLNHWRHRGKTKFGRNAGEKAKTW